MVFVADDFDQFEAVLYKRNLLRYAVYSTICYYIYMEDIRTLQQKTLKNM